MKRLAVMVPVSFLGLVGCGSPAAGPLTDTVGLTSSSNPSVFGQPVTLTATVTADAGVPTGAVTFQDNGAALGTAVTLGAGVATLSTSTLSVGSHPLTASYGGDARFPVGTSPAVTQVVSQAATTVALSSSLTPSVFGQSVTLTATVAVVAPGVGTPSGTVTFKEGTIPVGSCAAQALAAGVATCTLSSLSVGTHTLTATYGGDGNFSASPASSTFRQVVGQAATTVALTSSTNPSVFGQAATVTATLAVTAPGGGTPSGTVAFKDGTTPVGSCTAQAVTAGVATCALSGLSVGTHALTAVYGGDTNFSASPASNTLNQVVNQAATRVTLTSGANPSVFGQAVIVTATVAVAAPGGGTPSGTVAFKDGATPVGSCTTQAVTAGVATCTLNTLTVGTHPITAVYGGDTNFSASPASTPLNQVVNQAATTVALASSGSPTVFGQAVTLTATVATSGTGAPSGTVAFKDGATPISGCAAQAVTAGAASCTVSTLVVGTHPLTATYGGDANFAASTSATVNQVVSKAATSVLVSSGASPSIYGQAVTFTATISVTPPSSGIPTGTVAFTDGGATLATCAAQPISGGSATCTVSSLGAGTHPITAVYSGDANNASSTSSAFSQSVNKASTVSTVMVTTAQGAPGDPITFQGTVTANGPSGSPTGSVTFRSDGTTIAGPNSTPQPVALSANADNQSSKASFTTKPPDVSTGAPHGITVDYPGDANYLASTSTAFTVTLTGFPKINPAGATATTLTGGSLEGKILIAGGGSTAPGGAASSRTTWIYDPAHSSVTAGPLLSVGRAFHTATAIGGGQVLIAGGNKDDPAGPAFEVCTLDGGAPACVAGSPSPTLRCNAAAALVSRTPARVLIAGGDDCRGGAGWASWDLFDGSSAASRAPWISSGPGNALSSARRLLTATTLADGVVLLAGGGSATADLFTLGPAGSDSTVRAVGRMLSVRSGHTATLIDSGTRACPAGACVLLAGGVNDRTASTWEIFSSASGIFGRPAGAAEWGTTLRSQHSAVLLRDGRVLLAGGTVDGVTGLSTTELFDPQTLGFTPGLALQTARFGAAAAYAPAQDCLVLTGGAATAAPETLPLSIGAPSRARRATVP